MKNAKSLRYEIYVPTFYNNKKPIEKEKYEVIQRKIQKQFGKLSVHSAIISGCWVNPCDNQCFVDNCFKYEIIVDNNSKNKNFFKNLKEELKDIFNQYEIFMICTEVEWI